MGVRILHDKEDDYCCFYCSTSMVAFGQVMYSLEEAEAFLEWLKPVDPRSLNDRDLGSKYFEFVKANG